MSAGGAGRLPADWGKYYPSWGCSQNAGYWYGSSLCGVYPWFTRIPCSWQETREACMECCQSRASESIPFIQGLYDQQGIQWMCAQSCWNKPSRYQNSPPSQTQMGVGGAPPSLPQIPSPARIPQRGSGGCSSCSR